MGSDQSTADYYKATVEIPAKFADMPPINPEIKKDAEQIGRGKGLAEDVRYYGEWVKQKAFQRL